MDELLMLFTLAAVTEAVWEGLKPAWPRVLHRLERQKGMPVDRLGVLMLGVAGAFASGLDLMAAAGAPIGLSFLGTLVSGVLAGRVANLWHDFLGLVDGVRRDKKPFNIHSGL